MISINKISGLGRYKNQGKCLVSCDKSDDSNMGQAESAPLWPRCSLPTYKLQYNPNAKKGAIKFLLS